MIDRNLFETLFDDSNHGIFVVDDSKKLVYFNLKTFKLVPQLPKKPKVSDFENLFNLNVEVDKEITYDLFELSLIHI